MTIRPLNPNDAPRYRELRLSALRELTPAFGTLAEEEESVPSDELAMRLIETPDHCILGCFEDSTLNGMLQFTRYSGAAERHRAFLAGMYVDPKSRGKGFGKALLQAALGRARSDSELKHLNLTVVTGQQTAIRLYESAGFCVYATDREAFSRNGQYYDEHLMRLELRHA
ncbi:MAG TPA: GNAT family N-acetyltransferase [Roseimicrobium sp.]|nr:GNAT family N-acetyltransferase [Roseimicrobium sp.]